MSTNISMKELTERTTTHIAGMFAIHANEAFLNGATGGSGSEDKNISSVKQYWRNIPIPYVSSQAWRRWLRNTLIDETGWNMSLIEAIDWNKGGNTSQVAGQLNPIDYPEDDLFGYMLAKAKDNDKLDDNLRRDRLPEVKLIRTSPFKSSLLSGVPGLVRINEDEGFVHLKEDQPLPYKTEFYSGELTAVFGLEIFRLGIFENIAANASQSQQNKADFELDPYLVEKHSDKLEIKPHPIFTDGEYVVFKNLEEHQNNLAGEVMKALARLRGGSKLTQFGTDVSPKLLIFCGLSTGNLLFNDLLVSKEGQPAINIDALKEIITDYSDKITTPVFIGVRSGYLSNEEELKSLSNVDGIDIVLGTPISVVDDYINSQN